MCDWQGYERRGIMEDWDDTASINSCKTAEEMFRELGYEKTLRSVVEISKEEVSYANRIFEIGISSSEVYKFNHIIREFAAFTPKEILACAQLIKEMEASNA